MRLHVEGRIFKKIGPTPNRNTHIIDTMSSNDENEGLFDRLAKRLFASESSPLSQFADEQRAERLASCRHLEHILNSCQAESKNRESSDLVANSVILDDSAAEKTKSGTKIARFFRWDKYEASQPVEGNETESKDSHVSAISMSNYSEGCHKEIHELWACRALALGCGSYLKDLRQLWNDDAQISLRNEMAAEDSSTSEIIYEDRKTTTEADAREIQQMMAKCVTKNASELAGRIEKRRSAK